MSDITLKSLSERLDGVEGRLNTVEKTVKELPDQILAAISDGLVKTVEPQIQAMLIAEAGKVVAVGCKQLVVAGAVTVYKGGKWVVLAPVRSIAWVGRKTIGLFRRSPKAEAVQGPVAAAVPVAVN